jgi:hypothetical protein
MSAGSRSLNGLAGRVAEGERRLQGLTHMHKGQNVRALIAHGDLDAEHLAGVHDRSLRRVVFPHIPQRPAQAEPFRQQSGQHRENHEKYDPHTFYLPPLF